MGCKKLTNYYTYLPRQEMTLSKASVGDAIFRAFGVKYFRQQNKKKQ